MTIRVKVLGSLALLAALAVTEAALVLFVQKSVVRTEETQARTLRVRALHGEAWRALIERRAAERGYLLSGSRLFDARVQAAVSQTDAALAQLGALVIDPGQQRRLADLAEAIRRLQAEWPGVQRAGVTAGTTADAVIDEVDRRFAPVETLLRDFEARQSALAEEAASRAEDARAWASGTMLIIPAGAILMMVVMSVAVRRAVLDPLAALTRDAAKIAYGDASVIAPTSRSDEIGILVNALAKMSETERDRTRELTEALADLRATIETIPIGLIIQNADGSVRVRNRAAASFWGLDAGDEQSWSRIWASLTLKGKDGRVLERAEWPSARALTGHTMEPEEFELELDGRPPAFVLASAAPLRDAHGQTKGSVVAFQDVSRLRELDRLKDEFVSIVSHELRTPLTSIRGSLQLIAGDAGALPDPEHRQLLQVALNNCERLIRIINDILDISKIEAGRMSLQPRPVAVADIARLSLESVASMAAAGRVHVDVRLDAGLPAVHVDPDRMVQVVVNLLSNAIKFTPPRSQVVLHAATRGSFVAVSVTDQGAGIAAADIDRLFRKFHQVDGTASRRKGGTGLGLAISKALAEQHGGSIEVHSEPGRGATFTVTMPVARAATAPRPLGLSSSAGRPVPKRVLLVDDDDDFRLVIRRQLESAGYLVVEAREGAAALHVARQTVPDIIAVDLMMPGMNGWELIDRLAAAPDLAHIPVVVVSAVADSSARMQGAAAVLAKPVDRDGLLAQLAVTLEGRRGTVLVAEDDHDLRAVLAQSLTRGGYRVLQASDGREAIATFGSEPIDAVVLDLRMPNVDGFAVIRSLRDSDRGAKTPIIVVTGSDAEGQSRFRAMNLGADVYLAKPVNAADLARHVEELLTRAAGS